MSLLNLHGLGVQLYAYLRSQGCPLVVVDGPETTKTATWARERIVLSYVVDSPGDTFGPPRGLHSNAKHLYTAADAYQATIYAKSPASSATPFEHRARAYTVRETVMAGLRIIAAQNKNKFVPKSGGLFTPPDLAASETHGGAAYLLTFTYDLPIRIVTFAGAAIPEGNIAGGLGSRTLVSLAHGPDDDDDPNTPPATADTACGA